MIAVLTIHRDKETKDVPLIKMTLPVNSELKAQWRAFQDFECIADENGICYWGFDFTVKPHIVGEIE